MSQLNNEAAVSEENISVNIRVRPLLTSEVNWGKLEAWSIPDKATISDSKTGRSYVFDRVFGTTATNQEIYSSLGSEVLQKVLRGYNSALFCYGQTSSGKTFTMHGIRPGNPGIVPMTIQDLFNHIQNTPHKEFLLRCSYLELYNECINDLLNSRQVNLQLQEDKHRGTKVVGATEEICTSEEKVSALLYKGEAQRKIASTNFNLRSSRSHTM